MFRLIVVSALIAIALGASPQIRPRVPMLDGRIVGGDDANIEDLPHQVSLQSSGSHICGGSIISPTRIATAAHCTSGSSPSRLSVRVGSSIRGSGGQVIQVQSICQNPDYDSWTIDNDSSVLILASPIQTGDGAQAIPLAPEGHDVPEGQLATVSGWGTTSQGGSLPSRLQRVDVPRVTDADCKSAYGSSSITKSMICFGFTSGGKDSCQGDSGGPLVSNGLLVGIVSWGAGCAQAGYPGVYARVSALRGHLDSC